MITLDDINTAIPEYMEFALSFGNNAIDGGGPLLQYLGIDPELYTYMFQKAPTEADARGFLFGMSFGLWYLNTKLNMVVEHDPV